MSKRFYFPVVLGALAIAVAAPAQGPEEPAAETVSADEADLTPERRANRRTVAEEYASRKALFASDAERMVRPGLLASRADRSVEIAVEATGIAPKAIAEFFLIGEASGHDYEALFVSLATARDLDEALKFLGMAPGRNSLATPLAFWPRGERVRGFLRLPDGTERPLESLVFDAGAGSPGATLPAEGFVYCGSAESPYGKDGALSADVDGPCSVLSTYNEPTTLLDVPRRAAQNDVYERFLANPVEAMAKGALLRVVFRPEERPAEKGPRVRDYSLGILPGTGEKPRFRVSSAGEEREMDGDGLTAWIKGLSPDYDPYVALDWDAAVPCGEAKTVAAFLSLVDDEDGIRVEPPKEGQLYYRAFLPQESWRERTERPTQPLELRFARAGGDGALGATLVAIKEIWPEDGESLVPELKPAETPAASPEEFAELVEKAKNEIAALLVFAPADATLGEVMPYVRAVQGAKPNVYVFVDAVEGKSEDRPTP